MEWHRRLSTRLQGAAAQVSFLRQALRLVWTATRGWTSAWVIVLVVQGVLPGVTVYLIKILVDRVVRVAGGGVAWESIQFVLIPALVIAGVLLLSECLEGISTWIRTVQSQLVQDHITELIYNKSIAVDMAFYESPEFFDQLNRARTDSRNRPLTLLESSGSLLQSSITCLTMVSILFSYGAWLPAVLMVGALPAIFITLRFNQRYHQWWHQTTPDRRWEQYYDTVLTYSGHAAELRLFGLGGHFLSSWSALRQRLRSENLQLVKNQLIGQLSAGAVALMVSGAAMAWMLRQTLLGLATLGDLALFYQALNRVQGLMGSLFGSGAQIYTNSLYLRDLFEFLSLKPQVKDPLRPIHAPATLRQGIRFQQVTFRYPKTQQAVLHDFNLTIPAGQVVAIVGDNGAGKTTLTKLLCRFYDPEAGRIELDGVDIRDFQVSELRRLITVLFQFPVPYHVTAGQNIALGDVSGELTSVEIEAAARGAGAHQFISHFPRHYNTLLGKWFADGVELSGGEWQRMALARAFVRRAQILVLDEPTSSMDSWSEADWLERLRLLVNGRTTIIITHRLTVAMRADMIHVMRNGQIVESGSHKALVAQGGLYAQSWRAQVQGHTEHVSVAF